MIKIPRRLDDLVPTAAIEKVLDVLNQPELYQGMKDAVGKGVKDINPVEKMQSAWQQTRIWLEEVATGGPVKGQPREVINASGSLFGNGLAGLPMLPIVAYGHAKAASSYRDSGVEQTRAQSIAQSVSGAKFAAFARTLQASLCSVTTVLKGKRVVIATSDLVRLPGLGSVGDILKSLNVEVATVGASSGASATDWQDAFSSSSDILLIVSPSGLDNQSRLQQRDMAIEAASRSNSPVVELLADGVFNPAISQKVGLVDAKARIDGGSTVIVPVDLFLGGPSCQLIASSNSAFVSVTQLIEDTGASLPTAELSSASTALQMHGSEAEVDAVSEQLCEANVENLRDRAKRMAVQLDDFGPIKSACAVEAVVPLGPGPWNQHRLPTWSVELTPSDPDLLKKRMSGRDADTVIAYAEQDGKILLHLRFVPASRDHELVNILSALEDSESDAT